MGKTLVWIGTALCVIGVAVIIASGVMSYLGYEPSYNFGDPTRFEFFLIPFWQIGLAIGVLGGLCVLVARRSGASGG